MVFLCYACNITAFLSMYCNKKFTEMVGTLDLLNTFKMCGCTPVFYTIVTKGNYFCDFHFASLADKAFPKFCLL